jgi:dolichol-phosphate mannosyltransferase
MKLSIVVPFYNEESNVGPVLTELRQFHPDAEIIGVDDRSTDGTYEALMRQEGIRVHRLARHLGQSAATYAGLARTTGDVCVLMDGDGQSNAADIKVLLEYIPEYDLVNGSRTLGRSDSASRRIVSRVANSIRILFTRDGMRDTGGTPKIMKRECVEHLVPFDGLHRFIPALLIQAGFRAIEVPVSHRARLHGVSKHGNVGRALRGACDLIGVRWLLSRRLDASALDVRVSGASDASREPAEHDIDQA